MGGDGGLRGEPHLRSVPERILAGFAALEGGGASGARFDAAPYGRGDAAARIARRLLELA